MYSPPTSTYQLYIKEVKDHDETRKNLERAVNDNNTLQNQIGQSQEQKANDHRKIDELNRELARKDRAMKDMEFYMTQMSNHVLQEVRPNSLYKSLEEKSLALKESTAKNQKLMETVDNLYVTLQQKEDMMQVLVNQETSLFDKIKALEEENKKVKEELGNKNEHIINLKRTLATTRATSDYKLKKRDQMIQELKEELAEMNESDEEEDDEEEEQEGPDEKDQQIKELQIEIAKLYMTVQKMDKQITETNVRAGMDNRPLIRKYVEEVESHKQTKLKHSEAQNLLKTSYAKNNELIETHTQKLKDKDTRINHLELIMEDVRQNTAVAQKAWIDEKFYLERLIASQREAMEMKDKTEIIIEADLAEAEKELKDAEDKAACYSIQLGVANERIIQLENERAGMLRRIEEREEQVGHEMDKLEAHIESLKIDYKMSEEQRQDTEIALKDALIEIRDLNETLTAEKMNSNIRKSEMQDQIESLKMKVARGEAKLLERDQTIAEMSKVAELITKVYDNLFSDFSKLWDKNKEKTEKVKNNQEQAGTSSATSTSTATFPTSISTICENCWVQLFLRDLFILYNSSFLEGPFY
ncbi:Protein CBG26837 [Caenorhabditis briggsae]|uniref:Protein CBG26837 n=1 Tax=Caenorhabditis briggsae TaxID=6238 RepID=B6ILR1_CAEBR|nr:Protein CBG26837 [Caenorhabditis briggsae]CAS00841.1 Protein CBG26837 [Caenorhabditis briggsae]